MHRRSGSGRHTSLTDDSLPRSPLNAADEGEPLACPILDRVRIFAHHRTIVARVFFKNGEDERVWKGRSGLGRTFTPRTQSYRRIDERVDRFV